MSGPLIGVEELAERLDDDRLVVLEVDERPKLYLAGHLPGAHNVDWRADLHEPLRRDVASDERLEALWARVGITEESDIVLYGDQHNWYAAHAYWLFRMRGLSSLSILDGGRQAWGAAGFSWDRGTACDVASVPPRPRPRPEMRAFAEDVAEALRGGDAVVDVRTAAEYRGDAGSEPGYPDEVAQRAGHIPGAIHLPWERMVGLDGRFLQPDRLVEVCREHGLQDGPVVTYCRIGERSAHTWFVLSELLGRDGCRNYDGSWMEWGNMIGLPVATGDAPGALPAGRLDRLEPA